MSVCFCMISTKVNKRLFVLYGEGCDKVKRSFVKKVTERCNGLNVGNDRCIACWMLLVLKGLWL